MRLVIAVLLALCAFPAAAERRVALVVGNAAYEQAPALANPVNDANAIAAALERLGFDVLAGIDLDAEEMRATVRAFSVALDTADLALFYYAGHGIQVAGRNYLIPVDANIEREADVDYSTFRLDLILAQMERTAATRIVLLDACRNNPFERQLSRAMGQSRAVTTLGNGLAPIDSEGGAFIGFATDPGAVAYDGAGRHSPFTDALLRHLEAPGLEINAMMTRVRADVFAATARQQRPWSTSSLLREVYLTPDADAPDGPPDPRLADIAAWQAVAESDAAADYAGYLEDYPEGLFRDMAATRLAALGRVPPSEQTAAKPPAVRPIPRPEPAAATPPPPVVEAPDGCDACPRTVAVPGGETRMGNANHAGEAPVTEQEIAPFRIGFAEITVGEIRRFEEATGKTIPRGCYVWTEDGKMRKRDAAYWGAPGFPVTDESPAACLSWDDAGSYAAWLNERDPLGGWRLPSEAEFEYAAKGGDAGYPWAGRPSEICDHVNGADAGARFRWRNGDCDDGAAGPEPAGAFPANGFGLDAMIGNLWEWTADCWNTSHRDAFEDGRARTTGNCDSRVLRGGSWDDPVENLRATYRAGIIKTRRQANVGFRLVRELP